MKKLQKWFIYTVLIGLIPFFIRLIIYSVSKQADGLFMLNEFDFITIALVLNITNINELEDKYPKNDVWKTWSIGISALLIAIMAGVMAILIYSDLISNSDLDIVRIKYLTLLLAIVSLIFGGAVMYNLKNIE